MASLVTAETEEETAYLDSFITYKVGDEVELQNLSVTELNGKRGKILQYFKQKDRYEIRIDGRKNTLSIKPNRIKLVRIRSERSVSYKDSMEKMIGFGCAPQNLDTFIMEELAIFDIEIEKYVDKYLDDSKNVPNTFRISHPLDKLSKQQQMIKSFIHHYAEDPSFWLTEEDALAFLSKESTVSQFIESFSVQAYMLFTMVEKVKNRLIRTDDYSETQLYTTTCVGCSNPYDFPEHSHDGDAVKKKPLKAFWKGDELAHVSNLIHVVCLKLGFLMYLITWRNATLQAHQFKLVEKLTSWPSDSSNYRPEEMLLKMAWEQGIYHPLLCIMGLLCECPLLPKITHLSMPFLSILVARRPASTLSLFSAEKMLHAADNYSRRLFRRLHNHFCIVEELYAVVQFLNALPFFYYLGQWDKFFALPGFSNFVGCIATTGINILHTCMRSDHDTSFNFKHHGELLSARVLVKCLFSDDNIHFVEDMPYFFTAAATIEVLGRWAFKGQAVGKATIPCSPPENLRSRMTAAEIMNYEEEVSQCLGEYLPMYERLTQTAPFTMFAPGIIRAIIEGVKPSQPNPGLLHSALLYSEMWCSLEGCYKTKTVEGKSLKRCGGSCNGLARYCSEKHRNAHWLRHKTLCKALGETCNHKKKNRKKGKKKRR